MGDIEGTIRKPMIKPEGSRSPITDTDDGDRPIGIEFIIYNFPEIAL
jgi:hypothetical protein